MVPERSKNVSLNSSSSFRIAEESLVASGENGSSTLQKLPTFRESLTAKHHLCLCPLRPETSNIDARPARSVGLLAYAAERGSTSVTRASRPAKASAPRRAFFRLASCKPKFPTPFRHGCPVAVALRANLGNARNALPFESPSLRHSQRLGGEGSPSIHAASFLSHFATDIVAQALRHSRRLRASAVTTRKV